MTDIRDAMMIGRNTEGKLVRRPISPFMLGAGYRPQLTSVLSITNRITGIGLGFGTLLLTWWLVAAASGPRAYAAMAHFVASPIGLLLLFGWTAALFYHFLNGLRHLAWDGGFGYDLPQVHATGWAVVIGTVVLTLLVWLLGLVLL